METMLAENPTKPVATEPQAGDAVTALQPEPLPWTGAIQALESRVVQLEKKVKELYLILDGPPRDAWRSTIGMFENDPHFEEAVRLGREWREAQTYEKEVAERRAQGLADY